MKHARALEDALGTRFHNPHLLEEALTHSSYVNENPRATSNERLEFQGDAVLGLALAERLFVDYPGEAEGELTRRRAILVRRSSLAGVARGIRLGNYLRMGKGEEASGGRAKMANLAGALEAVTAAVFMDQGWQAARDCVLRLFSGELGKLGREESAHDYKSELQELVQSCYGKHPSYRTIEASGPDQDHRFTAEVLLGDTVVLARGSGRSKKLAQAEAARLALEKLAESLQAEPGFAKLK